MGFILSNSCRTLRVRFSIRKSLTNFLFSTVQKELQVRTPTFHNFFADKMVFDCVELRDGELMINSGVCNSGPKAKIFHTGGLNSLLPLLEIISGVSLFKKGDQVN